MIFSFRNILILLLIPIICIGTIFFSLSQVNEAELYNKIVALDHNGMKPQKRALHITKTFFPKSTIIITDKNDYKIKASFPLLSLLKLSPQPNIIEISRLNKTSTQLSLPELGTIINQLKENGIKQFILHDASQKITLRPTKKSTLLDITAPQYTISCKLYLDQSTITGGKVNLTAQGVNILDGVATQFFKTTLYSPTLNLQFKFANEDDKVVIRKMVDNKLNLKGEGIIPHDKQKMAQFFLTIPSISLQQLMESSPQNNRDIGAAHFAFMPNSAVFINTKIDEFTIGNEEISNLTLKMLNNSEEKQIALSGSFPSEEKFLFKSNHSYGSQITLYKSHGSHYNLNKLFENEDGESANNLVPVRWDLDASSTNDRFSLSNFSMQMEAADISGQDIVTMKDNMPVHDAHMTIKNVTVNDERHLPFITPLLNYLRSLGQNISDQSYLKKYVPLRNLSSSGKAKIKYSNITSWGTDIGKGEVNVEFAPANLKIAKLTNRRDSNNITLSANISAEGLTPQISFNILDGVLDYSEQANIGKMIFNDLSSNMSKALLNMDGNINLTSVRLPNDITFDDLKTNFTWSQSQLNLNNLQSKINKGTMPLGTVKTNTSIKLATPLRLSSAVALSNGNVKELIQLASWNSSPIKDGWVNFSAQATLSAKTYNELLENVVFKGNLVAANLLVDKLGLDNVIEDINNLSYSIPNLYDDLENAIGSGNTTFKEISSKLDYQNKILQATDIKFKTLYSAGRANISYSPAQEVLAAKAALSFEIYKPKTRNMPNRIIKSFTYTVNGDENRGYHTDIEAEELKDGLIAARTLDSVRRQILNRSF